MALLLNQRRMSQPQYACGVDWANPITRDLEFLWSATSPNRELLKGRTGTIPANDVPLITGASSPGIHARGGSNRICMFNGAPYKPSVEYTVATYVIKEETNGNPFDADDVDGIRMFQLSFDNEAFIMFNTGGSNFSASNPTTPETKPVLYAGRVKGDQITAWVNGISSSPSTFTGTARGCSASSFFSIGAMATNNGGTTYNQGFPGQVFLCMYWARALDDAELRSVSANPWQLFKPAVA